MRQPADEAPAESAVTRPGPASPQPADEAPAESAVTRPGLRSWRLLRSPTGLAGAILVAGFLGLALVGPPLWGEAAAEIDAAGILQGSSAGHPLGTDSLGRDILARVLVAGRLSLLLTLAATGIGVVLGVPLGALPAVLPRPAARSLVTVVNSLVAFPGLLLAMFTTVVMGLGARGAVIGIGVAIAPALARLTHTLSASVAGSDYVAAARVLRVPRTRILTRHVLPNVAEPLILNITILMGSALLGLAALSFLGLGVQPPDYDWGRMLAEGLDRVYVHPEVALGPAVAIVAAGVGFHLLGERMAGLAARTRADQPPSAPALALAPAPAPAGNAGAEPTPAPAPEPAGRPPVTGEPAEEPPAGRTGEVLEVEDLTVRFPGAGTPVAGVSLWVDAGEILGVVGESGSGKSLTALALGGLVPYPGEVSVGRHTLAGQDLVGLPPAARRKLLGGSLAMIFQDPMSSLNPALRVGSQLAEVSTVHGGLGWSAAWRRAVDRLRQVQIPHPQRRAHQRPHQFSGGMRQRATIAMGMMGSPRLLVADEPTTALDVTVQRQILDLVGEVTAETGAGAVFISHDMAVVSQLCHRVVVMYAGRVVEELPVEDLVTGPAHPYTRALVACLPDLSTDRDRPLATIPGRPPAPTEVSPGCPYAPRCRYATEVCHTERPPLQPGPDRRRLACWHPQTGPVQGQP